MMNPKLIFITVMGLIISFGTAIALSGSVELKYAICMMLGFAWIWTGFGKKLGFAPSYARRGKAAVWMGCGALMLVLCLVGLLCGI